MKKYRFTEHGVGYRPGKFLQPYRPQFPIIISWVKHNSRILDVGCGDGVLGEKLIQEKNCQVFGVDLDIVAVSEAKKHGIKAQTLDADEGLLFKDKSFDVVVASDCLQYMRRPDFVVSEFLRVGKSVIIEFPNFGFWLYRLQMLFGKFPAFSLYGHDWSDTLQTRFFSLSDFLDLPTMKKTRIKRIACIDWKNRELSLLAKLLPNFFGRSCILEISG